MSQILPTTRALEQPFIVELYNLVVDPNGSSTVFRFCNDIHQNGQPVRFKGNIYTPVPIESEGFEQALIPPYARPTIRIGNLDSAISLLALRHSDFIGARFIRRRTYSNYLGYDANAPEFPQEIFKVERKDKENQTFLEFELITPMEGENVKIPNRYITRKCPWAYRGAECGYVDQRYYDQFNRPVPFPSQDKCAKTVEACKIRFGANSELRHGGFPNADII
jgi:lambda family phage minor tail protein L